MAHYTERMASSLDPAALKESIRAWGRELGFQKVAIAGIELDQDAQYLTEWLSLQRHGEMEYMAKHGEKRWRPDVLVPGTLRAICVRMDYWPGEARDAHEA